MCEKWREIKNSEGYYISNFGNVKGVYGRVLKQQINPKTGYLHVGLRVGDKRMTKAIHRLVAESFLEKEKGKNQVNHKDGNKTNNHLSNLEWVTPSVNRKHAYDNGLFNKNKIKERGEKGGIGAREKLGKVVILTDEKGNDYRFLSAREACRKLGLDRKSLNGVLKKKKSYYTIKGYTARYEEGGG